MAYMNYVVLTHSIIIVICLSYAIYASLYLLFKRAGKKAQVARTPVVILYFWFIATSSILMIVYMLYIIIFWNPEKVNYNPMVFYYITGLPTIYVNLVPVADFFLCADRCFCVIFPFKYNYNVPKIVGAVFVATDVGILALYFILTKYFAFYTSDPATTCFYYICLVWKLNYPIIMTYTKYAFCGACLVSTILLIIFNYLKMSKDLVNKLNKPVIAISIISLCFAFLPALILQYLNQWFKINASEYIGDLNLTMLGFSHLLSVHLYLRSYKKHLLRQISIAKVVTISTHSNVRGR